MQHLHFSIVTRPPPIVYQRGQEGIDLVLAVHGFDR